MNGQPVVAGVRVCGLTLVLALCSLAQSSSSPQTITPFQVPVQADDQTTGSPTFRAESRQVIVEAEVWEKNNTKDRTEHTSTDGKGLHGYQKGDLGWLPPPTRGLTAADFQIFDNGTQQKINYFREEDFPALNMTNQWRFVPTLDGIWGASLIGYLSPFELSSATYLLGYTPRPLRPGECRAIRVIAENREIRLNRAEYCADAASDSSSKATEKEAKLRLRMERLLTPEARNVGKIHVQASVFWSSGVLALAGETERVPSAAALPASDFTYVVEVHDSRAPASVHIATAFDLFAKMWDYPCPREEAEIRILGAVYDIHGRIAREFGDTLTCQVLMSMNPEMQPLHPRYILVPTRFDTQIDVRPGDYELRVVVSDGKKFGQARLPLHVESLDPRRITMSDVTVCDFLRDASWILRDAASVSPFPVNPAPLVSKNVQFFPAIDNRVPRHVPVSLYFEIYKSLLDTDETEIYYNVRVTDLKSGALVMNTGPMSAAKWVVSGNEVIPIGLNLDTKKLPKGSYRFEVQASDSAGRELEWRTAKFNIQ